MSCKQCGQPTGQGARQSVWEVRARELDRASDPHGDAFREIVREAGVFCSPKCLVDYLTEHYGPEGDFYRSQYHEPVSRVFDSTTGEESDQPNWLR